jgi:peptidyl-prolyl cis-trans isomerase D
MSSEFKKKSSSFFVTAFIGLIIVSFMFTGYESMRGSPDAVATVGNKSIKVREYQNEYNRQLEFYQQFFGGGSLSAQQIRDFGISQNAINSLVSGKLLIKFSEQVGIKPSPFEIKEEIKDIPAFQNGGRFDIERYKALLLANGLTPSDFESEIAEQLKAQRSQVFFSDFPISNKYLEDVSAFRSERVIGDLIQLPKERIRKFLPVSKEELNEFFAQEFNQNRIQATFEERKPSLDQEEEVKARHILISTEERSDEEALKMIEEIASKTTARNFIRMANENTEDPSGRENGGDLGWFGSDGRMVPEFEEAAFAMNKGQVSKPIKTDFGYHIIFIEDKKERKEAVLEDYQEQFAKEIIQRNKVDELDALVLDVKTQLENHLRSNNQRELEKLIAEYELKSLLQTPINRFDGASGEIRLTHDQIKSIFTNKSETLHTFDDASNITFVNVSNVPPVSMEEVLGTQEQDRTNLKMILSRKLQEDIIQDMRDRTRVRINTAMIR